MSRRKSYCLKCSKPKPGPPVVNRHGHRDWLVGLVIYRHGLRVSEACDLRWDDIDLRKRTIIVRRLKGSTDSVHYLERDELNGLKLSIGVGMGPLIGTQKGL